MLLALREGLPVTEPLYFGERGWFRRQRALLVTKELIGYRPLDEVLAPGSDARSSPRLRNRIIDATARVIRRFHEARIQHNCLYPKHIFVRLDDGEIDVKIIDLEKAKRPLLSGKARSRDLDTLYRRSLWLPATARARFWLSYLGEPTFTPRAKRDCRRLVRHARRRISPAIGAER